MKNEVWLRHMKFGGVTPKALIFQGFRLYFFVGCPCISARLLYSEPSVLLRLRTPHPLKILRIKLARKPRFANENRLFVNRSKKLAEIFAN
jgi:hypothetical protein